MNRTVYFVILKVSLLNNDVLSFIPIVLMHVIYDKEVQSNIHQSIEFITPLFIIKIGIYWSRLNIHQNQDR